MKLNEGIYDKWIFKAIFLAGGPGCLSEGSGVIMFDGSIKRVEEVKENDLLMGPDSKPRKVLSLIKGTGRLFKIIQNKNDDYIVNEAHVLSLKKAIKDKRYPKDNNLININILDYINKSNRWKRNFYGWRSDIFFEPKEVKIDPYFLGIWLGDGSKNRASIYSMDKEIEDYLIDFTKDIDQEISISLMENNKAKKYNITDKKHNNKNRLISILREYNLINNKHVPDDYLYNSKEVRYKLLAGLLDADGSLSRGSCFDFVQKNEKLSRQVKYLCNSLGLRCTLTKRWKVCTNNGKGNWYWKLSISGDIHKIPTKISRKKVTNYNKRVNPKVCSIKIKDAGIGKYFGFELDGDGLFLLKDFTVTHNSGKTMARKLLMPNFKSLDPDELSVLKMKKVGMSTDYKKRSKEEEETRDMIHTQAKEQMFGGRQSNILAGRLPIVIDRTGADYPDMVKQKKRLEDLGYETKMIFIDTPLEIAHERNLKRKRKMNPNIVNWFHKKVRENVDKFRDLFGSDFIIIDGSRPYSEMKPEMNKMYRKIAKWMTQTTKNAKAEEWRKKEFKKKDRSIKKGVMKLKNEIKRPNERSI